METLKLKSIFFSLLAVIAMSVLMTSCEQNVLEDLNPVIESEMQERDNRRIAATLATQIIGKWWHSHEENVYPITQNIFRSRFFLTNHLTVKQDGNSLMLFLLMLIL